MKRLFFLSVLLVSVAICGTAFAADITGTYVSKDGTILIEKSNDANLVRVKFKNGHTSEFVTAIQNSNSWIEKTILKKVDNAYYVKIQSKKGDCNYEGLTVLKGSELTVDDDMNYPIFSISLDDSEITPNIPRISGGDMCSYLGLNDKFKKK